MLQDKVNKKKDRTKSQKPKEATVTTSYWKSSQKTESVDQLCNLAELNREQQKSQQYSNELMKLAQFYRQANRQKSILYQQPDQMQDRTTSRDNVRNQPPKQRTNSNFISHKEQQGSEEQVNKLKQAMQTHKTYQ